MAESVEGVEMKIQRREVAGSERKGDLEIQTEKELRSGEERSGRGKREVENGPRTAEEEREYLQLKNEHILPISMFSKQSLKKMRVNRPGQGMQRCALLCTTCCSALRSLEVAKLHTKTKAHLRIVEEKQLDAFLLKLPCSSPKQLSALTEVIERVYREQSAVAQKQVEARIAVAAELEGLVQIDYPDVTIEVFGSTVSGFALVSSNVNLNLTVPGPQALIPDVMKRIVGILSSEKTLYTDVIADFLAFNKIPRVLFKHEKSGVACELRAMVGNPMAVPPLLKLYGSLDERAHKLGVVFRHWATLYRLDDQEKGHYPSHTFVVMVIHYLQQRNLLPVLHDLKLKAKVEEAKRRELNAKAEEAKHKELQAKMEKEKGRDEEEDEKEEGKKDEGKKVEGKKEEGKKEEGKKVEGKRWRKVAKKRGRERKEGGEGGESLPLEYMDNIAEIRERWKGSNSQSLGELWYDMLKYYAVGFQMATDAVTMRQLEPLKRDKRSWGSSKLAVEDPMIPRSNLARAACSDRVHSYLMACLKRTLFYFTTQGPGPGLHPAQLWPADAKLPREEGMGAEEDKGTGKEGRAAEVREKEEEKEGQEGTSTHDEGEETDVSSVVATTGGTVASPPAGDRDDEGTPSSCNQTLEPATQLAPNPPTGTSGSSAVSQPDVCSSQGVTKSSPNVLVGPGNAKMDRKSCGNGASQGATGSATDMSEILESIPNEKEGGREVRGHHRIQQEWDGGTATSLAQVTGLVAGTDAPGATEQVRPTVQKTPDDEQRFYFSVDAFSPQIPAYPTACVNCRKSNHIAKDCPEEKLIVPNDIPMELPSNQCLRAIKIEFKNYMKAVVPKEAHLRRRKDICDSILADIHAVFPSARLELFGSSANGFGSWHSDLDICMILGDQEERNKEEVIKAVAVELDKHRDRYRNIIPITSARVPIVRFIQGGLECDISLENCLALQNTRMLAAYAHMDERVRLLGYAIKHMAKVCDMGDASCGSLSSYAYTLLMLHYLQRTSPPVLPVLQKLYPEGASQSDGPYIESWNCYYYQFSSHKELAQVWPGYQMNHQVVGELWLGFLRYFSAEFDWNKDVVTIRQLEPLTKFDKWWLSKCMCIEDPFNLDHNLSASISPRMRIYILDRFMTALYYHSENIQWEHIDHLMDQEALVGDSRAPKFLMCLYCNLRGHKAQQCPRKQADREAQRALAQLERQTRAAQQAQAAALVALAVQQGAAGGSTRMEGRLPQNIDRVLKTPGVLRVEQNLQGNDSRQKRARKPRERKNGDTAATRADTSPNWRMDKAPGRSQSAPHNTLHQPRPSHPTGLLPTPPAAHDRNLGKVGPTLYSRGGAGMSGVGAARPLLNPSQPQHVGAPQWYVGPQFTPTAPSAYTFPTGSFQHPSVHYGSPYPTPPALRSTDTPSSPERMSSYAYSPQAPSSAYLSGLPSTAVPMAPRSRLPLSIYPPSRSQSDPSPPQDRQAHGNQYSPPVHGSLPMHSLLQTPPSPPMRSPQDRQAHGNQYSPPMHGTLPMHSLLQTPPSPPTPFHSPSQPPFQHQQSPYYYRHDPQMLPPPVHPQTIGPNDYPREGTQGQPPYPKSF